MRRIIPFLLLAATSAAPLAAQAWDPQGPRPDRGAERGDLQRRGDPRAVENGDRDGRFGRDDGRGIGRPDDRADRDRGRDDRARNDRGRDDRRDGRGRDDDRRYGDGRPGDGRDWRNDGRPGNGRDWNGRGGDWRDDRGRNAWNDGRGGWNDRWRNDRRYDWQGYRASNRNLYRAPRYYGPRGYDYSRWSRGYRVQPYFYGRNYWINDPYRYRLPPAYGDYRWVRYYDDVALIDIRSGLIQDIIYAFFYR